MKKLLKCARIVTEDTVWDCGNLLIEDGVIRYVGTECPDADEVEEMNGSWLVPGFIDIHCHGGNGYDFMDASPEEMRKISDFHLKHGTTTLLATTMTDSMENIEAALDRFATLRDTGDTGILHGVHMEGPHFSPAECGAQDPRNMTLPTERELARLTEKYPFIERVSIAPELSGAMETGSYGKARGIVMSIGHTDADFDTVLEAEKNGYTLATHLYSGMHCVIRKNAYRIAGAVEGCLYADGISVELIADGKHLPPSLLKYVYKIKGAHRICLVTDANRGSGGKEGDLVTVGSLACGTPAVINDGVAKTLDGVGFAGSVATADRLFRTMLKEADVDIRDVCQMTSTTPARVMGYNDRGSLAVGKRADIVCLAPSSYNVREVYLNGTCVCRNE